MSTQTSKGTALVTGASTGIGAVYADRLAKRGYDLILVARSLDKLSEVSQQIRSATGRKVETLTADLTLPADVKRVGDRLAGDGSITVLVNNAGVAAAGKLLASDPDFLEQMIQLNVTALTRLALAAAVEEGAPGLRDSARSRCTSRAARGQLPSASRRRARQDRCRTGRSHDFRGRRFRRDHAPDAAGARA